MKNLRIVLVEDDPRLSFLFIRMLSKLGHHVVASVTLEDADAHMVAQFAPDLVLVDVVSTEHGGGLELAHAVTSGQGIPGVLISNHSLDLLMESDATVGECHFLRKPFFVQDLRHVISQALPRMPREI